MPLSYSRIGRVDWASDCRQKVEHEHMTMLIVRLLGSAVCWMGMLIGSAFMAQSGPEPAGIDLAHTNIGTYLFIGCAIGLVGFTWTIAAWFFGLRAEQREMKKDIRMLKRKSGIREDDETPDPCRSRG